MSKQLIPMSNHWKDMHILHPHSQPPQLGDVRDVVISKAPPALPVVPSETLTFDNNPNIKEVCEFINIHNRTDAGTVERIDEELITKLMLGDTTVLCLRYQKTNKIMGVLFSTMLPLQARIGGNIVSVPHAYTYYLCVHTKLRGKAVAMALIRELIRTKHSIDYYCGYHIVDKIHTANYITVDSWFRPIDYVKAKASGFGFLSKKQPKDKTDFRDHLFYGVSDYLPNGVTVAKAWPESETLLEVHTLLTEKCNYLLAFEPDGRWYGMFDTYLVRKNGTLVGIFSLKLVHPFNVDLQTQTNVAHLIWVCGTNMATVLTCAVFVAKHYYKNLDVLYGYKLGGITDGHIQSIHAGNTPMVRYLEFYNNSMQVVDSQISVPII